MDARLSDHYQWRDLHRPRPLLRACSRGAMPLYGVDDPGEILGVCDDEDDFEGELNRMIMVVDHAGRCIGCGARARICPNNCQTLLAAEYPAA